MLREARQIISCPGGCGRLVHPRASFCPRCGYRAEITNLEEVLASISTVSSILAGFTLAAIVGLATADSKPLESWQGMVIAFCWLVSSIMLVATLLAAEVLRRNDSANRMDVSSADEQRLQRAFDYVMGMFNIALAVKGVGIVFLGFYMSIIHGIVVLVETVVVFFVLNRIYRS